MHLIKPLAMALSCLSTGALSFKIRAFSGADCTGSAREINVWDNTCRDTDVPDTRSFRVLAYGAKRQRAGFYRYGSCMEERQDWWADGGSDTFIIDRCVTLNFDATAYGSVSA
ncbi:hypothetical protein BDW59DRAFT_146362 [Aspergillus cavernicola]|uniref:Cyanovirin-N n=1 Tax=Aspergillus cavernicola TaxID=176166 RepID=A0ABR4IC38_9EURO